LLRFRRYSVYETSAVFLQIPDILRITVRYSASHISAGHAYTRILAAALGSYVSNERRELDKEYGVPYLSYMDTGIRKSKENLHKSREPQRVSAKTLYC